MTTWQERERLRREAEYAAFLRDHTDRGQPFELEIVFDGPPGPEAARFIECQDAATAESLRWGKWLDNGDGTWSLCGLAVRSSRFDAALGEDT